MKRAAKLLTQCMVVLSKCLELVPLRERWLTASTPSNSSGLSEFALSDWLVGNCIKLFALQSAPKTFGPFQD